jgi:pimeloyl-ACP methyl ester carboxylesterase
MPQPELFSKLQMKTLIVIGTEEAFCTVKVAEVVQAGILGSELIIHNSGHFPWIEDKEQFARTVSLSVCQLLKVEGYTRKSER